MSRTITIASFGMNNRLLWGKTQEEMAEITIAKLNSVKGYSPDLVCFPEVFLETGGDGNNPNWQDISKETIARLQEEARQMKSYIIASVHEPSADYEGYKYISALLIDRRGEIVGKYRKIHTVYEESTVHHVIPGSECPVFDTDFGRIGILICFDIGWREEWKRMEDQHVDMVVWLSAYDGGNLLNAHAAYHMYYVVSSVRTDHARIIDMTGNTLALGSIWDGLALATINLDTTLFHIDRHYQKIDGIRAALGNKVTIVSYSEVNVFTITPNDPQWPIQRICETFGLMPYRPYHQEATELQLEWRQKFPSVR